MSACIITLSARLQSLNVKMDKELQLAEEAIDRNDFDKAAEHCKKALDSDGDDYEARL